MLPGPVSGSRGNGLPGSAWVSVADLDPRVADALLDRLAAEGIPAYVAPAHDADPLVGSTRSGQLRDRLWVDGAASDRARAVVAEVGDEPANGPAGTSPDELDFDSAWQEVLASLRQEPREPVARWPVAEDLDAPPAPLAPAEPGYDELEAARQARYDEEDHYVPPPPPPVPRLKRHTVGALVTIVIGIVLLFDPLAIGQDVSMLLGVLAVIGGVGALVYRMREGPPTDSGPDDGAVV